MIVSLLLSAIIQLGIALCIPVIFYMFSKKRGKSFFEYIGLKKIKINDMKRLLIISVFTYIILSGIGLFILFKVDTSMLATGGFYGMGLNGIIPVLIYAIIQTSLSEEILFRGFILRKLSQKYGFIFGNIVQALLFGLLHGLGVISFFNIIEIIIITVFTFFIALTIGYINNRLVEDSIIPGVILHALSNLLIGVLSIFEFI